MDIRVKYHNSNSQIRHIKSAMRLLNSFQNYFYFIAEKVNDDLADELIDWNKIMGQYLFDSKYTIFISDKPFTDNWFSHESERLLVITTYDWATAFAPPSVSVYIAYQVVQAALSFSVNIGEDEQLQISHKKSVGCIFDFCQNKKDIKLGMVSGIICPYCKATLYQYNIDPNAVHAAERVLERIRREAIGQPYIMYDNSAFIVMQYTENDENNNAYEYGIKSALEEIGINCVRADDAVSSTDILNNLLDNIKQNRFIIVKADTLSRNVYFELGYAMGLNKEILVIVNDEETNLPVDTRNIGRLVYKSGDYKDLKRKVIDHYKRNYHY